MRTVCFGLLAAVLSCATPAVAQGTWNALPDRFQIDTGYFRLDADTLLRYQGPQGGSGEVDMEEDAGLPESVDTFWVDATWRVGRRHQLKLGFTRSGRDRRNFTLQRDFTWGGEAYDAGMTATSKSAVDLLGGCYRFAIVRNDRFEIGPAIGVGYIWLDARIQASGRPDPTASRSSARATGPPVRGASPERSAAMPWPGRRSGSCCRQTTSTSR